MADDLPPDSPALDDDLVAQTYYSAAKSSVIIGVLTFFPGIALIFIWYLAAAPVLAGAIIGLYRGVPALRHTPRGGRIWMVAIVGVSICAMDIVMALAAFVGAVKAR